MATQVQYRRGSAAQNDAFTGALGEITVDTTNSTLRIHNGVTAGGSGNLATVAYVDAEIGTLSADSISNGTSNVKVQSSNGNVAVNINGSPIISFTSAGIKNDQANGVGNIGSSGGFFNTVFAKATSAQYADLAERYIADAIYEPGTVLEIGGSNEVTQTMAKASARIAGVVSTAPAVIMNATENAPTAVTVALLGRVPCRVVGYVNRGDVLCSSDVPGHACVLPTPMYQPGVVIGKALENHGSNGPGVIEVLVGRL